MKTAGTCPLALFPAVFLAVAVGCVLPASVAIAENPGGTLARAGGLEIKSDEVRSLIETLGAAEREAVARDPALLSQAVRGLLVRRLVAKEAREKKFDQKPEVRAKLDAARDAALIELYLQSVSEPPAGFPSRTEIEAAYEANKTAFVAPRQYKLAQIFIAAPKGDKAAEDKAKAKLDAVTARLKEAGADFGRVAAELSDMKSEAETGGEIGWVTEDRIRPEIRTLAAGLAKDGNSEPVRLDDGFHIVRLLDTKPAGTLPLAEIEDALSAKLRQTRSQQLREAHLAELLRQNPTAIDELALSRLVEKKK